MPFLVKLLMPTLETLPHGLVGSSDFFSQNIAVLKSIFPLLADEIEKAKTGDGELLKIEAAASGAPTLALGGRYVHSKRDPEREAERLAEAAAGTDDESPALVLGFGLGYAATALAAKFPERPIIIVEKRPEIIKKALEQRDLKALLSREKLVFVLNSESVAGALSLFKSVPGAVPLVIKNPALCAQDPEWYAAVDKKIAVWNTRTNVNRATQKRFGKRWVKNLAQNLGAIRDIPGISHLEGLLSGTGIPVFLAAAGPSLDEAGPILEEIHKRCLVIAVDTSLRFLRANNIHPDFVLSVDPQFWNSRHLDWVSAPKTRLVAESAVYPTLLRQPFGAYFLCGSFFPLGRFIEDRLDPKGDLGTGGSVATSAWDFARHIGGRELWISGLDLSFPELKTHFKGALFEEKSQAESGRFSPVETRNFHLLRDGQPFRAKKNGGGTVLTDKRLSLYAAWFENRLSQFPELKNYSLSPGGLEIKGLKTRPKEELLATKNRREEINSILARLNNEIEIGFFSEEANKNRAETYCCVKETLLNGLKEIKNLASDAEEHAETAVTRSKMGHLSKNEEEKVLEKLEFTGKAIENNAVREIIGFLFPDTDTWEAEIAAETQEPLRRHLLFSLKFHKALAEAASFNIKMLSKE